MRLALPCLGLSALLALPFVLTSSSPPRPSSDESALASAERTLEDDPDSFEKLDAASRAALSEEQKDAALWYAGLALEVAPAAPTKDQAKLLDDLHARVQTLDPIQGRGVTARLDYENAILAAGVALAKRKSVVTAVGLLSRLKSSSLRDKAEAELAKIFADKKAVEVLLDSGVDVPAKQKVKRTPQQTAKLDAAHATWDKFYEVKGDMYTVRTDMGVDMAEAFSLAMEQANRYYRKVFHVKESGGSTVRVVLKVYRSREDFDANEKQYPSGDKYPPEEKGFYSNSAHSVSTYDPREEGFPLSFLWSTLFHESSHQFTAIAFPSGEVPTWLNEGTASYFEGTRLLANGALQTNLVAEDRLSQLVGSLKDNKLSLTQVVTCPDGKTYNVEYYPFGWGLAYFFHNYENEKSERVYLQPYRDYMASYKSGAKHDVKARFIEYFVTKAKQPGVASFEDFEKRWKDWIIDLDRVWFGGEEVADELVKRAGNERANKQFEAALETYTLALRKRPTDAAAQSDLGEVLEALKKPDAALFAYRRALELLRTIDDETKVVPGTEDLTGKDMIDVCLKRIERLDKFFSADIATADEHFATAATEAAKAYADAKYPLVALSFLDSAGDVYGRVPTFRDLRASIAKDSKADPRRWRRVKIDDSDETWEQLGEKWSSSDGALACKTDNPSYAIVRADPPTTYRFEARFDASGLSKESGFTALLFGDNGETVQYFGILTPGLPEVGELDKGWKEKKHFSPLKPDRLKSLVLAVEVREREAEYFIDGKSVGKLSYEPSKMRGRVGIVAQGGSVSVSDVRLRY